MNNSTSHSTFEGNTTVFEQYRLVLQHAFVAWLTLEALLVVLTNSVTLIILWKYARFETPSNIFIACLTLADLSTAAAFPLILGTIYLPFGSVWSAACFGSLFIGIAPYSINIAALCTIAIDRLIYIKYALEYHTFVTVKKAKISVCIILLFTFILIGSSLGIGYQKAAFDEGLIDSCIYFRSITYPSRLVIAVPSMLFMSITICCYIKIGLIAYQQSRAVAPAGGGPNPDLQMESNFKIAKVMFNILIVFIGCNSVMIIQPLCIQYLDGPLLEIVIRVLGVVWKVNTWINPIIYVWKSKKFRTHVLNFLRNIPGADNTILL